MKRFLGIWVLISISMAALCQPVLEWLLNTADFVAWPLLCGLAALVPAGLLSVWLSMRNQAQELERRVRELETDVFLLRREREEADHGTH